VRSEIEMGFKNYLLEADSKIGKTIIAQIKALDKWAMMAWGAKNILTTPDGVQFEVRGSKFRGKVIVALDKRRDYYNIEFGVIDNNLNWQSRRKLKMVSAENLVSSIDGFVG
jgi:hypothetical protein